MTADHPTGSPTGPQDREPVRASHETILPDPDPSVLRELTKPVRGAEQRPTPRWVGWFLILLPTLAGLGPLLGVGPVFAFRLAAVVLFITAAWDWHRYRDRSRTFVVVLGLLVAFQLSGVIALLVSRPPLQPALIELGAVGLMFAVPLALVQLYRTAETVLTVARGWLYLTGIVLAVNLWEVLSDDRLPNFYLKPAMRADPAWGQIAGPFHNPNQLASVLVMSSLVMAVGFSLEHDRRLRWAYLAVCLPIPLVVLKTGSTLGLGLVGVVTLVWLGMYRWGRLVGLPLAAVAVVVLPQGRAFLAALWGQYQNIWNPAPEHLYSSGDRLNLILNGVVMLRRSWWLGVGPAGYPYVMSTQPMPYPTHGIINPHSGLIEIASQYGIGTFVLLVLVGAGLVKWSLERLRRTRGASLASPQRVVALWALVAVAILPVLSMMHSSWLNQSMSAMFTGTLVMWARHIERPLGRRVTTSEAALRNLPPAPSGKEQR
ncbi:MAG: O-antigen ligase family protein [Actinomycetia bacterium]|nr:O-antigen ligase family protein [Actinomycetes bacterium]